MNMIEEGAYGCGFAFSGRGFSSLSSYGAVKFGLENRKKRGNRFLCSLIFVFARLRLFGLVVSAFVNYVMFWVRVLELIELAFVGLALSFVVKGFKFEFLKLVV